MTRREPDTRYRIHDSISTRVDEMKQLVAETEAEADAIDDEMSALKKRIGDVRREMELLYGDVEGEKDEMRYDLTAVFIHRGASAHAYLSFLSTSRPPSVTRLDAE